jgi:LysM repeat protein
MTVTRFASVTVIYYYNLLMRSVQLLAFGILLSTFFLFLSSCTPQRINPTPLSSTLIPFLTSSRSPASSAETFQAPVGLVTAETPLPSLTPFTYTVQRGDTLGSVALTAGVSIDDLQAANPEISPNEMAVGQVLKIPINPENASGEPTPTPVPFTIQQIECYPTADKGMWCFVLAHNDFSDFIENLSAQVTLVDASGTTIASQTALSPLNILPPNTSLPLSVFFPPEIPLDAKPRIQILTAIRLLPHDERYLPATINNTVAQVNEDGRSARLSGQVLLPGQARAARQIWVAGTAYDEAGHVVGVRRWESGADLSPGGNLPFEFMISSAGGKIAQVEFAVEARP